MNLNNYELYFNHLELKDGQSWKKFHHQQQIKLFESSYYNWD
jgi:hypothetical protein